ncbi:hypothetical protein LCGC14_0752910 [marine sediment metagenome]|uniref:Uncharacterized protein n=1 Tax=marine sediment metagenome TaxID=412755 RepID=A0A0F9QN92_9ZZZZ
MVKHCDHEGVIVELPDWVDPDKQCRGIGIDACIVASIQMLWENHIETRGCCCGHGKEKPSVIIIEGCEVRVSTILHLLSYEDDREWDIFQWQLVKIN